MSDLAIYRRPGGRFIVKRDEGREGLWAMLGPKYTRESAQALADSLTKEMEDLKREAKMALRRDVRVPAE